jgi:hypothetical protein
MSLYEGTNGIQSMDLMGRKLTIDSGAAFEAFKKEIYGFCARHRGHEIFGNRVQELSAAADQLCDMATKMRSKRESDPVQWACSTYPALMCFGDIVSAWRLLDLGIIACALSDQKGGNDFYTGKKFQAAYFCDTTLPLTLARIETCVREGREIGEMPLGGF